MASIVAPAHVYRPMPVLTRDGVEVARQGKALEKEAERLQREIRAAVIRNTAAVDSSKKQAQEVKTFEERSRDTLRDLMVDMGKRDGTRD